MRRVRVGSCGCRPPREKMTRPGSTPYASQGTAKRARSASLSKEIAMTMPNIIPSHSTAAPAIGRGFYIFLVRLGRLVDRWVAAAIARRERQAALFALRQFSDRELRDIGLNRCDIGAGLAEAAKSRLQMQLTERS